VTIVTLLPLTLPLIVPDSVPVPDSEPEASCVIIQVCAPAPPDPQQLHVPEMFTLAGGDAASAATPSPPAAATATTISTPILRETRRRAPCHLRCELPSSTEPTPIPCVSASVSAGISRTYHWGPAESKCHAPSGQ
jgi:hypothetical protein